MTAIFIKIRFIQFFRIIKQLGWLYATFTCSLVILLVIILFNGKESTYIAYLLLGGITMLALAIHINRKDQLLIQTVTAYPQSVYIIEYLLIQLIPFVYLLINKFFLLAFLSFMSTMLIALIPSSFLETNKKKRFAKWPVNSDEFEWIAGLRKNYIILLFIYALAIISIKVPFLSLLFAWYLAISITSFYKEGESLHLLIASEKKTGWFLLNKVWVHQKNYWKFILPIVIVYTFLHPTQIWLVLIFVLFVIIGLTFTVLNKYSNYEPEYIGNHDLLNALVFGSVLIPFLAPLPVILSIRVAVGAYKNLKQYLG